MPPKELLIVGGANGVGKTTFALEYGARHNYLYLGADAIAAELAPLAPESLPVTAGKELIRRMTAALSQAGAIVLESTLSGRTLRHTIGLARVNGYTVSIVYLYVDSPDMCVQRVLERVRKGGHLVPETDVRRRFSRSINNFWHLYRPLADRWLLAYNSGDRPVDVAVGFGDDVSVRDPQLYATFSRWVYGGLDG